MQSVAKIMKEYFGGSPENRPETSVSYGLPPGLLREQTVPLAPVKVKWQIIDSPQRFLRKFKFDDRRRLLDFVSDVMAYEDEVKHHGLIQISGNEVEISVYTHTLEQITELDREYVRSVDKILRDVADYRYKGQ